MESTSNGPFGTGPVAQNENTNPEIIDRLSALSTGPPQTMFEDLSDTEDVLGDDITFEDASSLLEPAISQTVTRLKSSKTPAAEKAMILEENGGYFEEEGLANGEADSSDENITPGSPDLSSAEPPKREEMSLGKLPSPRIPDSEIPITPWQAGPKDLQVHPQPSMQGVFSGRNRSLSNGAETLRKLLPKGLPSMAQIGDFLSSNSPTKGSFGISLSPKVSKDTAKLRKGELRPQASSGNTSPRFESIVPSHPPSQSHSTHGVRSPLGRQGSLRRVTSDDSLLYHSLSRASSLGDDTRFENQREMVNSRMKAIKDSLQDRSSFRMPSIPSIPSMPRVPSFSFNMNFLNSNSTSPMRSRANTDPSSGILSSNTTKKKPSGSPTRSSTMTNSVAMEKVMPQRQRAATDHVRPTTSGQTIDILDSALEGLTGDVVIMGGYRGSILRSTKTNRQLWVPVKVGLNIRKVDLEVGLEPEDEENMHKKIYSSGMLQNIGPVDISKRLIKRLNECESARNGKLRVWDYGYDWRLSPHLLSRQLTKFMKGLPSNQPGGTGALVIAHSLGGIITRHVVNHHPSLFSGVLYAGVPQSCVNILGPMRMGDAVLLSSRVLTAQVNFTFRTSFVLLPEDGQCFSNVHTKEKYPIDLFNVDDWIKYRLSPCTDQPLPPRNQPPPQTGLGSFLSLPISGRKSNVVENNKDFSPSSPTKTTRAADVLQKLEPQKDRTIGMQMDSSPSRSTTGATSVSTHVTLPRPAVIAYLRRTLSETKKFKQELHFNPSLGSTNAYPPLALIYGKSIPTVSGAKVDSRDAIPHVDCYDHLSFGSGDGVCLAKEAMLPEGYRVVKGGRINSDRGHVTLLGDLAAVGRAIQAVRRGRERGIGLGLNLDPRSGSGDDM